ncbi:sulfite exporter TauE/SafE family protein [Salinarimonas ramus]|uniref:Probable membrane transporter protein n=1 Tax=Salinarimonas ramus TaxID=690164 RepID=A0A917V5L9_9HYPH|nr:sulfite exporter TauE/SafE family protein [Salinarimonas ramus]GGK40025.1 membrane protein [Salinarimonas ramus]
MSLDFFLIVFLALGLGGVVKGAIGLGLPIVSIPVLAAFLGVPHALAVIVVPLVVTNAWQIVQYRAERPDAPFLLPLVLSGLVGIALGTWALAELPVETLSLTLATIVTVYIATVLAKPTFTLSPKAGRRLAPLVGIVGGTLQGATGISAPVTVTFIHAMRLTRGPFIFAVSVMFLAFSIVQGIVLAVAGFLDWWRLVEGVLALAPIALGMPLGNALAKRLSRRAFERLIVAILAVMAVRLFQTGLGF